jgi:hypothetical protein
MPCFVSHNGDFVELADLAVPRECRPGIDKVILMQESWPLENDKEKDKQSYRQDDELGDESEESIAN